MLADASAAALACMSSGPGASGVIGGIAGGLAYGGVALTSSSLGDTPLTLAWLHTPRGKRDILSETVLLDEYGLVALKEQARLATIGGRTVAPLTRVNGLW